MFLERSIWVLERPLFLSARAFMLVIGTGMTR